jgi:hypothetical protein
LLCKLFSYSFALPVLVEQIANMVGPDWKPDVVVGVDFGMTS